MSLARFVVNLSLLADGVDLDLARPPSASKQNSIVHVADFGAPYAGNFIASLQALAACLPEVGLRQILVLPARARQRPWAADWQFAETMPIFFLSEGSWWARAREVASIIQEQSGILIHTHFCPADWIGWLARERLRRAGARHTSIPPLVWHYHSPPVIAGNGRLFLGPVKYRVLSRSIKHVAVSEGTLYKMVERGIPKRQCHLVWNSIDFGRATSPAASRLQVRLELAIGPEQKCFLLFGHDPERKGVDLALKAMAEIVREHPDVVLVIIGQEKMRRYVRAILGDSNPGWLRLADARETVADYYNAADFFLSPSRVEGLPYAVLEALANRLPVIATDIPGMDWARELDAVRLCLPAYVSSLTAQVRQVLLEPAETRLGAALRACEYVRDHHSTRTWAREMLNVYSSLIGCANKGSDKVQEPEPLAPSNRVPGEPALDACLTAANAPRPGLARTIKVEP